MLISQNGWPASETEQSSDINWAEQHRLNKEWLKNNPNAGYGGWVSI